MTRRTLVAALAIPLVLSGCSPPATDTWLGQWDGPEGTLLRIAGGDGTYELTIQNLDGPRTFQGRADGGRIRFERDGVTEFIRATSGVETGMKWLTEKSNCLTVRPGEGYCRDSSVRWPIPAGWKHETFALPPGFAPEFRYHGSEDLRFMPGFSSPEAPDFWSYDFVWWLDEPPPFDPATMGEALTTYFQGLATAVGGAKYTMDPARFRTVLAAVPASAPPRLTGQVFTYDAFATGQPITLNVEAELRSCPGTREVAVVVALSPKDTADGVWATLRATADTLVCR